MVMDLSFISLRKVLIQAWQFLEDKGYLAALVKPQFECKKEEADIGRGIIKDKNIHHRVLEEIKQYATDQLPGSSLVIEIQASPSGNDGNTEFFLGWRKIT